MSVYHVLLVEDNDDHALITVDALESVDEIDVHVTRARDGHEALGVLENAPALPDLILLDVQMPRLDGFATLRRLKENPVLRVIPVVMLSSSDDERDVATSFGLGSNSYVRKPVTAAELHERLSQIPSYWFRVNTPPQEVQTR